MQIKCTSCGATQQLEASNQCGYCGNIIEKESAENNYKSSTSGEIGNLMMMAETAIEATNWEEAMQYFNKALEKDITNSDAWLGKGIAIVYTSKIGDIKTTEAIAYWKNAIKHAANAEAMSKRVAKEINSVVNGFYPTIERHYVEFQSLDNSYQELVSRFSTLENAQDFAIQLDNQNITFFETGYELCKRVINLPKLHADVAGTSALVEGIAGQFSSNKYSRQSSSIDASNKYKKANERKKEIETVSKIVLTLELKYIEGIKRINPTSKIIPSGGEVSVDDEFAIEFVSNCYEQNGRNLYNTQKEFKKKFNVSDLQARSMVREILLKKRLITDEQIKKEDKNATIIIVVVVIIIVAGILFGSLK